MSPENRMKQGYIICVDDQAAILDSLLLQLESAVGDLCHIEAAESAQEALDLIQTLHEHDEYVEMLISDEVMPGMKGSQLLETVHRQYPHIVNVMLTGQAGLDAVAYAINHAGLHKYFTKPWEYEDLHLSIRSLIEKSRLIRKNQELTTQLQEKYQELEEAYNKLSDAYRQLKDTQDQLIRAEKLSLIGQLSSGIAHEVKNQLNMIGFAELIREAHPEDATIQKYTDYILRAGANIYNLVDEMRRFAKQEQPHYEIKLTSVIDALERLLHFIRFDHLFKSRKIIKEFENIPLIPLNEEKFGQVMINLLRNAAQATQEYHGEIILRVLSHLNHVQIDVEDNGCGISEGDLEKIWEPFFTTKGDDGTGLGLDICRRIVEEHHGTLTCRSELHRGSTFTIHLPIPQSA